MHEHSLSDWQHEHNFANIHKKGERRTRIVLLLTFFTMLIEIVAGIYYGSMALLADGWHMGTHVAAFFIALIAYRYSRIHANDDTFAFSTAKVGILGGFASSIALGGVALFMVLEALQRFFMPHLIQFDESIAVAGFGLAINLISALLLQHHDHDHDHGHSHKHEHSHPPAKAKPAKPSRYHRASQDSHQHPPHEEHAHDHNLKAAYLHVVADAFTSVLAIFALLAGKYYDWNWLDPAMGIVGGIVISRWSYALIKETAPILLDESVPTEFKQAVIATLENDADNRISDIHIWRVGHQHYAMIVALVTATPQTPLYYKQLLTDFNKIKHITIEVNQCPGEHCPE